MNEHRTIIETLPGIAELWKKTKGNSAIRIAILDGPVDLHHHALKNANIISLDIPIKEDVRSSHGTFVSSLIFADHTSGIQGIAPNCSGMMKSIYHEDESGKLNSCSQSDIEQGILAALEQNVDIINISGGEQLNDGEQIISSLAHALEQCEEKGVLVVAATGNEGDNSIHVPASYPTVLAVGSMNNHGVPSTFSNWNKETTKPGLVAPGEDIIGAIPSGKNKKAIARGTSFSTALVSGVAALLASLQKQQGIEKNLLAVRQILLDSVTPCALEEGINCDRIMTGRLNITDAMTKIPNGAHSPIAPKNVSVAQIELTDKTALPSRAAIRTKPQNSLTLNTIKMKNETEIMPLSATIDHANSAVELAASPSAEEMAPSSQEIHEGVSPSVAEIAPSECSKVLPSEASATFNPAINSGGYPTFKNAQLINAIGQPSYDFATSNNLDTFTSLMKLWYENLPEGTLKDDLTNSPHDHKSMAAFLLYRTVGGFPNAFMASQLIWLLNMNSTPMYSISPNLANFSEPIYLILEQFLADNVGINSGIYSQYTTDLSSGKAKPKDPLPKGMFIRDKDQDDLMRMVLPGYVSGKSKLINGNYIISVTPVAYGLKDWTLNALVDSLKITEPEVKKQLTSILNRLYVSTLNKGQAPDDRALNYSLYNIVELSDIVKEVVTNKLQLSGYKIVPSKISRQNSISREVQLSFFDPENTNKASTTYAMQIDVSGVTPVMIGETQKWYAPISVTAL